MSAIGNLFQYFVPNDRKVFFPLFEKAAANLVAVANTLIETVNSTDAEKRQQLYQQIDKLEHIGDEITHQIYIELGKNFITPFDREDIHALATSIDDICNNIQGAANRMNLYSIENFTEPIIKLSEFILQGSINLEIAVKELRDLHNVKAISDSCIEINRIENQADEVYDRALAHLFVTETDAINLIKYKEILTSLESAMDMCEDAADVMETIMVKNV